MFSAKTKTRVVMYPGAAHKIIRTSPKYRLYSRRVASRIKNAAILVFESENRKDNEWRLSETTPPKYVASFRLEWRQRSASWRVVNDDPAWYLVEYGAHAGGNPNNFVLKYRPLARGLDIVAAGGG